jgi:hypothetical protein
MLINKLIPHLFLTGGKKFLLMTAVFVAIIFFSPSAASGPQGRINVGLNYPGVSLRYGIAGDFLLEGKAQFSENATVAGSRIYYNITSPASGLNLFGGLELSLLLFEGDSSKGNGMAGSLFAGGEYFANEKISVALDMGPAVIALSDSATTASVSGVVIIANISVNYYLR